MNHSSVLERIKAIVAMPWNAFVAAFLYYTLLAALALGGASARGPVVAGAYSVPMLIWGVTIGTRLVRLAVARVAAIPVLPWLAANQG
jgi:hypothetical protein